MKGQVIFLEDEDHDHEYDTQQRWWKSEAKLEECTKLKLEMMANLKLNLNMSKVTPTLRVVRELERLAAIAPEGLDELRHKLFTYRSGDFWIPTGGIKKEEMDIPPVNTILLLGFHNAGKSSLINLMYTVLGRSGLVPFAQTSSGSASNHTTLFMEEHNVLRSMHSGFCVYDTRGFDYDELCGCLEEVSDWMTDGVHHNQLCLRSGDSMPNEEEEQHPPRSSYCKFANRRVNCVMVVANVAEINKAFKVGDKKPLEALRLLFCSPSLRKSNENPILILTHGDKLSSEERIESRVKICERLGVSESSGVYDVVCLTEYGLLADESDPVTAYALTEAVYRAMLISDRGHLPKKDLQDQAVFWLSWLMCCISSFFGFLANLFSKLGQIDKRLKL